MDSDLAAIQEARNLVAAGREAQAVAAGYSQERIDDIVGAVARACAAKAEPLAEMAVEETGFGVAADKAVKNRLASEAVYAYCKDMKTVGIVGEDAEKRILEVASPVGVVAAIIPSTNPTSTVIFKAIIALKAGNAVIFSPHPGAVRCIGETVAIIREALARADAPQDLVQCLSAPTLEATGALMRHPDIGLILATGGPGMVKAAYSSGNPAIGVGAGNGPAFIERSADIPRAVKHIIASKTFDNGTICASEQSVVTEECIRERVEAEWRRQGGYFLSPEESGRVAAVLMRANGSMNPRIVGRPAATIAEMAGIPVPEGTRVLLSPQTQVGRDNPYSREKLCPVLGYYVERDWEAACARCIEILRCEGIGHTMVIHSDDDAVIREFALKKPVMRLLVNTPAALGGVGATTGLAPSLTLGCGAAGGSATSDNVTPLHLLNIKRVAWGLREPDGAPPPAETVAAEFTRQDIERIAMEVIGRMVKRI